MYFVRVPDLIRPTLEKMKLNATLFPKTRGFVLALLCLLLYMPGKLRAQFCTNNSIFGLTQSGYVYSINQTNGVVGAALNTYSGGNAPSASNALGYNPLNGCFYFFKRNPGGSNQEFVRLCAGQTVPTTLAACPTTSSVVRGCASFDGAGYYCIDNKGYLYYYNITYNTWVRITTKFVKTNGSNMSTTFTTMTSGDMAIDGYNRLWIVVSSNFNYGLYKVSGILPTTSVASITLEEILPVTTATPGGGSFAGICFNSTGQVLLGSINEDKLYRLENNLSLRLVAGFSMSGIGNDLTSCAFPMGVLGDEWKSFQVVSHNSHKALLKWEMSYPQLNNEFTIQYSKNGTEWIDVGSLKAGQENSNGLFQYVTTESFEGKLFFRIAHADKTGKTTYSLTKVLDFNIPSSKVKIWPVPASDFLFVEHNYSFSDKGKILVFDQLGNKQLEWSLQAGINKIPLGSFDKGSYYAQVQWEGEPVYRQIILKQ